ncbi:MAG: hypothetical protein JNM56_31185, partial [Planctomycetia bacterium]|nr:hypothetical protein [Planctomycetia bacterium]
MRCRALLGVMGVLGCMLLAVAAEADLDRLVRQLGSDSFSDREAAMKALDDIGLPALPALKKAAQSLDAETRRRAEELVARIEKRQESARLLAPTKVSLQLQDVPLPEAVAELAKLSGQPVKLGGDVSKLAERKVSLEFKEVPFWEALDRFCRVASLAEATTVNSPMAPRQPGEPRPRGRRPVLTPNPKEPCIMLVDGKPGNEPTHFAGAARIRALPVTTQVLDVPRNPGEI